MVCSYAFDYELDWDVPTTRLSSPINQCMMEVRRRIFWIKSGTLSRWTEWYRCPNESLFILQMKGVKNIRVCNRCADLYKRKIGLSLGVVQNDAV